MNVDVTSINVNHGVAQSDERASNQAPCPQRAGPRLEVRRQPLAKNPRERSAEPGAARRKRCRYPPLAGQVA